MKFDVLILLLMISSVHGAHRRILHQPLFPASSYPPPDTTDSLLPPLDSSDQPFFPEDPNGGTQNQTPVNPPPPPPPSINGSTLKSTASTKPTKRAATAIAISIGIVTLGILSTLLFFICRNKAKLPIEERKMEDVINGDGSRAPPSRFLYIGTVNPHDKRSDPSAGACSSPDVIKHAIIPSIKKTPPPQETPRLLQPLPPEKKNASVFELKSRAKFGPPPPPPNLAISTQSLQPPPPPLPPPPPSLPAQPVTLPPHVRSTWTNFIKRPSESASDSQFPTPPASEAILKEELGGGGSSSGRPNGDHTEGMKPKPKLKPLHWDKVRATSDRATAWDQLKPSSFPLNEDMMESLFGCNSNKLVKNEATKRSVLPPVAVQENRVLDPKKSQNIAILLRALNVTRDEVSEALLDGNTKALGAELLGTLVKMAPTKEEEIKLTGYRGDASKLGSAEKFLKAVLDIPFAFKRVESMLYRANFDAEVKYLSKSFQTLEEASSELRNSRLFLKLLEAVLTTGNRMNVGTNRGGAKSFTLDTLLKLVDIKGTDGKTTLLHFVVQEIIRSEDPTNSNGNKEEFRKQGLSREFRSVKLAAVMDSNVLHSNITKLETGLQKVMAVLECEKSDMEGKFFESMKAFHSKAKGEICRIKDDERKALTQVKEVTEYFQGDAGKEEARPLGIFVIVRDFLSSLDHVCKDVGTVQDRQVMGASRSFRISSNAPLPVLSRYNVTQDDSSSEESSSP